MERPFSPPEDSPLPDIPAINFDPPLSIQRQAVVHTFLRLLASTPRFAGTITKLLDAGCGDATFIRRLIPCDDALPVRHMTGVDIDEEAANSQSWSLLKQPVGDEDGRWHELDIRLLHGSFEALRTEGVGYHEVIVSIEGEFNPIPLQSKGHGLTTSSYRTSRSRPALELRTDSAGTAETEGVHRHHAK